LGFRRVSIFGDGFDVSHDCPPVIAPGASCTLTVVFAPTSQGRFSAQARIDTNASSSPDVLLLSGAASGVPAGRLVATPSSLSFADQIIGTTSAPRAVAISNSGDATAVISGISVTGDFAVDGTCGNLAPGESCSVRASFTPTDSGLRAGQVVVTSNASNSPLAVNLEGQGVPVPAPRLSLSASALGFGNRLVGSSATQTVTATNSGAADLVFGPVEATGDYRITNGCTGTLAPTQSCTIAVEFIASMPGSRLGDVMITSNASGSPHRVTLAGVGCRFASTGRGFELVCSP